MAGTASSNLARLRAIKETTFGETPKLGASKDLRFTGESLNFAIQTDTSKEIRADRQIADLVQLGAEASGDIQFELSYGSFDEFIAAALGGEWTNNVVTNGTSVPFFSIEKGFTDIDQYILYRGMGVNTMSLEFAIGSILTGSFGFMGRDSIIQSVSGVPDVATERVAANTVAVNTPAEGDALTAPTLVQALGNAQLAHGGTITLVVGGTHSTDSGDITFSDAADLVAQLEALDAVDSAVIAGGHLTIVGSEVGEGESLNITAVSDFLAPGQATMAEVMNSATNFADLLIGGVAYNCGISQLSLSTDAGLRAQNALGKLGACTINAGTFSPTGSMTVYFADAAIYTKYLVNTPFSLSWGVQDAAGNRYDFELPRVKITSANPTAGGLDTDVELAIEYQALFDAAAGHTIKVTRTPAQ